MEPKKKLLKKIPLTKQVRAKKGSVRRKLDPSVKEIGRPVIIRHRMIERPVETIFYYGLFVP